MHEVQDRGNIVDEVKITLPISSSGSDEGRCEDTTESSLRGVLTVHSYWVGAQMLWQVNYRIRMSGRGTGWIRSHKSTP